METSYQNLYSGLYLTNHGTPQDAALSAVRRGPVPEFQIVQAMNLQNGNVAVVSPPPYITSKANFTTPIPKGKYLCCIKNLDQLVKKEMTIEGQGEVTHTEPAALKQGNNEFES